MAAFDSPIPALQSANFVPLNSRNIKNVEKIVYADKVVFAKLKNGSIATSSERLFKNGYYTLRDWSFMPAVLKGLIYLGVITKKQADEHRAAAERAQAKHNAWDDERDWRRLNEKYGKGKSPMAVFKQRQREARKKDATPHRR